MWQLLMETSTREELEELLSLFKQVDDTAKQHRKIHCFSSEAVNRGLNM